MAIQTAPSEESDQPAQMRRLIWIFAGLTCPKVGFLSLLLICCGTGGAISTNNSLCVCVLHHVDPRSPACRLLLQVLSSYFMSPVFGRGEVGRHTGCTKVNPSLAEHNMPCLSKQYRSRSVGFWSGSALFVIKYVNFYQKPGSCNLIGWKLDLGVAS